MDTGEVKHDILPGVCEECHRWFRWEDTYDEITRRYRRGGYLGYLCDEEKAGQDNKDNKDFTLIKAVDRGHVKCVNACIAAGANVNNTI